MFANLSARGAKASDGTEPGVVTKVCIKGFRVRRTSDSELFDLTAASASIVRSPMEYGAIAFGEALAIT
ncbi:MAG TPA: hypothetical protein VGR53_00800 [Nitrososphaerales archaeon]|nr:hypothetical protein [Nitrososphaerales archaeon]